MTRRLGLAGVALALAAAGCGGGDSQEGATAAAGETTTGARPSPPPASNPAPPPPPPKQPPPAPPAKAPRAAVTVPGVTTPDPAARTYALAPTRRCLSRRGAGIGAVPADDAQLRALGDLAQRTSVLVRVDGGTVGLAIERQQANAALLAELLRAPGSPYRVEQRVNAVLVYRPASRGAAAAVRDCLHG